MEEETISMTIEEDNNQYNPIEINDNRIYDNYVMSIENEEDKDDKEFNKKSKRNRGKSGGGYERERGNGYRNTNNRTNH
ncbi:hypothetical protein ENUP19_0046G0059 [Entamoeba nuttalli]|uniref:Uncharacterized protein n=1 Tax=Entamoeba nuttalli TaxID=412467 RepID=A0ABQ0DAM6_9EUKA